LIAPAFSEEALRILTSKKNRIILKRLETTLPKQQFKSLLNGVVQQDKDLAMEGVADMKTVSNISPTEEEFRDLVFANKIVKHTKSNTIVLVKDHCLLASGVGQTSRVDALKQAIEKAHTFHFPLAGAAMASDAFFPFPDCVEIAADAGITAILQP